ncbi:MAG: hypothetical protein GY822_15290, partial [Deltaproteobacteria bacterium]|nr:hypothetical protein [Deltaproteobacteria bacterium]
MRHTTPPTHSFWNAFFSSLHGLFCAVDVRNDISILKKTLQKLERRASRLGAGVACFAFFVVVASSHAAFSQPISEAKNSEAKNSEAKNSEAKNSEAKNSEAKNSEAK